MNKFVVSLTAAVLSIPNGFSTTLLENNDYSDAGSNTWALKQSNYEYLNTSRDNTMDNSVNVPEGFKRYEESGAYKMKNTDWWDPMASYRSMYSLVQRNNEVLNELYGTNIKVDAPQGFWDEYAATKAADALRYSGEDETKYYFDNKGNVFNPETNEVKNLSEHVELKEEDVGFEAPWDKNYVVDPDLEPKTIEEKLEDIANRDEEERQKYNEEFAKQFEEIIITEVPDSSYQIPEYEVPSSSYQVPEYDYPKYYSEFVGNPYDFSQFQSVDNQYNDSSNWVQDYDWFNGEYSFDVDYVWTSDDFWEIDFDLLNSDLFEKSFKQSEEDDFYLLSEDEVANYKLLEEMPFFDSAE